MASSQLATHLLVALVTAGVVSVPMIAPDASTSNPIEPDEQGTSGSPANKVVGSGSTIEVIETGAKAPILTANAKTSKPTDMIFTVSLECTILTRLLTNEENPTATAQATVLAWVEVDGDIVPINSVSSPPQDEPAPGTEEDKVTFCDRTYSRTVTDQEDPQDGMDQTADYINTKSSHAFTWIRQNMGSGDHEIIVWATLTESATSGEADAIIGNRVLVAEPTKMANDAVI